MRPCKFASLLVIAVLITSGLTLVNATSLQDIPKPSAPEFTVKIVSYPYDVPAKTTTSVDQYTGEKTTTTTPGYHVENKSIEITVRNPTFTPIAITQFKSWDEQNNPYFVDCNYTAELYFTLRVKGHFGDDWQIKYSFSHDNGKVNLESKYTVITIGADYSNNSQLDFQVKASIGFFLPEGRSGLLLGYRFYGIDSDWSNTKTLTMGAVGSTAVPQDTPASTPTAQPTPTTTPAQTQTTEPTQTPTNAADESLLQGNVAFGLIWQNMAIVILCIIVAGLMVTLFFISERSSGKISQKTE